MFRYGRLLVLAAAPVFLLTNPLAAQKVSNPKASIVDVLARHQFLKTTRDPRIRAAIAGLESCLAKPLVAAPSGRIEIPHHYLNGSHGPTNPAEAAATRVYAAFESRVNAGMNQYAATGSEPEAKCALDQLDAWAHAGALLDYDAKDSTQAWFQVGWTLCAAGISESVLAQDRTLDAAEQKRVAAWLNRAAHELIGWEKPGEPGNNLHYWRALAATSIGVLSNDTDLFQFGARTYKEAIGELDANGALPREMTRHERATHYQAFALQPLVLIAEFAARQHVDLYGYKAHDRSLRDAIVFFGRAVDTPEIVKQYTTDAQLADFSSEDFAPFEYFVARYGSAGMPRSIVDALMKPTAAQRIGGSATVLAAK
ncbi:MAG TPA: alginate lyase family protein [Acidobacteriaceae bacterium]|jgi:poly(beta-D-mannuronate) lyase